MIHALISGTVFRAPQVRTAKNGNAFVTATLKVADGSEAKFVSLMAFDAAARAELDGLDVGDALSIVGKLAAEVFEKDGKPRVSLRVTVDKVLALKPPQRAAKPRQSKINKPPQVAPPLAAAFDDAVPW